MQRSLISSGKFRHVAFEVADLASELAGREILIPPNSPSDGVRVAFIVENGAPITARIHRPQPSWPPPAEQDADINTLYPKRAATPINADLGH